MFLRLLHSPFIDLDPTEWRFCMAEGEEGGEGGSGGGQEGTEGKAEGDQGAEGKKAGAAGEGTEGAEGKGDPTDWRATLPDDLKSHAERFPSVEAVVRANVDQRKQLSTAVVPPGKDAKPEEIAAYHKKIGVPESAEKYVFTMPEGRDVTDGDKAFQTAAGTLFHGLNITNDQAAGLNEFWNQAVDATEKAQVEADKAFADSSETELRKEWPGQEYDKNKAFKDRAVAVLFGDQLEKARHLESKDGRYILDHPVFLKAFALVGREMAEGGLVPPLSDNDKVEIDGELKGIRDKIAAAQAQGNSKEANRLFQEEQALIAKKQGNQGVVGGHGRVA